ncbi:MAG: glycosyltransferase [Candidatus Komeilibacteria bacterium]
MISGKKILYVITQSKYGGAQKYVLDLAKAFTSHNSVSVAVGELNDQDQTFFQPLADQPTIQVHRLISLQRGINLLKNWQSVWELKKLYKTIEPDLVHINSSMAGFTASLAAHWYNRTAVKKIKVVYTAHGFVFDEPLPVLVRQLYIFIERLGARWKDAIITVSDQSKLSGVKHGLALSNKFTTIHNGISLTPENFFSREQARLKLHLPPDALVVGSISSCYPTKGLRYLIEAAYQLARPEVQFIIIGGGPEKDYLQELIGRLKLTKQFYLAGAKAEAWRYLPAFDLFVLPSVKEGHPYAILEAGLTPLPVIASNVGGIPEIINHDHNGWLVPPADAVSLAAAITKALEQPAERTRIALALQQTVQREFSLSAMITKTDQVYQRLLI